jgi:hypothetical protein
VFCYGILVAGALGWYDRFPWLDNVAHFFGGAALAYFFGPFVRRRSHCLALVLAVAVLWELSEVLWDGVHGTQTWKGGGDTTFDLLFGLAGAAAFIAGTTLAASPPRVARPLDRRQFIRRG